ncbi:hypothetical protein [Gelatiniphilus marinus]|uniref:Outer membrane protein beta-barrel domain-containing protein n=1 Tax=Gelatiniphilus marinus TaxID=1759464 RepID=A0ABW5JTF6_9FLAO
MKTLLFLVLFSTIISNAQKSKIQEKKNETINLAVNLNDIANNIEETLKKGKYKLKVYGKIDNNIHYINIKQEQTIFVEPPLEIDKNEFTKENQFDTIKFEYERFFEFEIKNRTKFEVVVQIMSVETNKLVREIKITYNSLKNKKWISSVGISSNFLINKDTYRTVKDGDLFKIKRDGSQEILQIIPLIQFSFINLEKDSGFAPTGGIGFDTENISAFIGGSYYIGQNVFITGGISLHKQKRLNNLYNVGQELSEAVDKSTVNIEYYRFNPFISFTYRFSSNILKK